MLKASCACGKVAFEIHGAIHSARYCHCTTCRKFSGTASAAWGLAQAIDVTMLRGEANISRFDSGGGLRAFCSSCGAALWYEPAQLPEYRGIPLGVIDTGDVPAPQMHVWTQSQVAWAPITDALPQYPKHP